MKVRLNTYFWMNIILNSLILVVALFVLVTPLGADYRKITVYITAGGFLFDAAVKAVSRVFIFKREFEEQDERDIQIQNKAANRAIDLSAYTLMTLLVLFQFVDLLYPAALGKGILLAVFGIFLPGFYKNCLCLYYQKHGELI